MTGTSDDSTETTPCGKRKVAVTHHFEQEIDVDRLDEWLDANFPDGRVQVVDLETGEHLHDGF